MNDQNSPVNESYDGDRILTYPDISNPQTKGGQIVDSTVYRNEAKCSQEHIRVLGSL
jgi:hypothetical protein